MNAQATTLSDCLAQVLAGTQLIKEDGTINATALGRALGCDRSTLVTQVREDCLTAGTAYRLLRLARRFGRFEQAWQIDQFVEDCGRPR